MLRPDFEDGRPWLDINDPDMPKNGEPLLLLIDYSEVPDFVNEQGEADPSGQIINDSYSLEDVVRYGRTIGWNTYDDNAEDHESIEDKWNLVGWNWQQDYMLAGKGKPIKYKRIWSAPPEGFGCQDGQLELSDLQDQDV